MQQWNTGGFTATARTVLATAHIITACVAWIALGWMVVPLIYVKLAASIGTSLMGSPGTRATTCSARRGLNATATCGKQAQQNTSAQRQTLKTQHRMPPHNVVVIDSIFIVVRPGAKPLSSFLLMCKQQSLDMKSYRRPTIHTINKSCGIVRAYHFVSRLKLGDTFKLGKLRKAGSQ